MKDCGFDAAEHMALLDCIERLIVQGICKSGTCGRQGETSGQVRAGTDLKLPEEGEEVVRQVTGREEWEYGGGEEERRREKPWKRG